MLYFFETPKLQTFEWEKGGEGERELPSYCSGPLLGGRGGINKSFQGLTITTSFNKFNVF
jgi:hypothetical protein